MDIDEVIVDGVAYVSVRDAAAVTGYTRDYVGQLARAGKIDAVRTGRTWLVRLGSLTSYKDQADTYVPVPPAAPEKESIETIVGLDGKEYISAKRASELSHYSHDYITQMAREGKILAQQIAGKWYVERVGLLRHKAKSDAELAAMHARSSGFARPEIDKPPVEVPKESARFNYTADDRALFPNLAKKEPQTVSLLQDVDVVARRQKSVSAPVLSPGAGPVRAVQVRNTMQLALVGAMVLVLILAGGYLLGGRVSQAATAIVAADSPLFDAVDQIELLLGAGVSAENSI